MASSFWNHVIQISIGKVHFQDIYSQLWIVKFFCWKYLILIIKYLLPRNSYVSSIWILIQGGSDKSGTLSKLHRRIKKSTFLIIISCWTVSALCRSRNRNKQTHSGKNKSTRSYETYHSLQVSRRGRTMRKIMNYEDIKKGHCFRYYKRKIGEFFVSGGSADS